MVEDRSCDCLKAILKSENRNSFQSEYAAIVDVAESNISYLSYAPGSLEYFCMPIRNRLVFPRFFGAQGGIGFTGLVGL